MIAVIDNYDSFTYNLVQYLGELGVEVRVFRNDAVTVDELDVLDPSHVVISPGPGDPSDAGVSRQVIREMGGRRPVLGVCLGHQCIGDVFGGQVVAPNGSSTARPRRCITTAMGCTRACPARSTPRATTR